MSWSGLALFTSSLAIAAATPGVATMTVVARVLGRGTRGAAAFCFGLVLGDLVWLSLAVLGLAAIAERATAVILGIKLAGALYLLVLARASWAAPTAAATEAALPRSQGWATLEGAMLQLGNPKAVLFYLALVPALVPLHAITIGDLAVLGLLVAAVLGAVNAGYIAFAMAARRQVSSPRAMRRIHRVSAAVLAATAAFLVVSALTCL